MYVVWSRGSNTCSSRGVSLIFHSCVLFQQSLLLNHEKVETEVKAYSSDVDGLKALSRKIVDTSFGVPPTLVSAEGRDHIMWTQPGCVCM